MDDNDIVQYKEKLKKYRFEKQNKKGELVLEKVIDNVSKKMRIFNSKD